MDSEFVKEMFVEESEPSQENEWSCICVLRVSILSLSTILFTLIKQNQMGRGAMVIVDPPMLHSKGRWPWITFLSIYEKKKSVL